MSGNGTIIAVAIAVAILAVGASLAWYIANAGHVAIAVPHGQVVASRN